MPFTAGWYLQLIKSNNPFCTTCLRIRQSIILHGQMMILER